MLRMCSLAVKPTALQLLVSSFEQLLSYMNRCDVKLVFILSIIPLNKSNGLKLCVCGLSMGLETSV